jgi:phenylpropionate dioxygenase-like ring-hydroxylating dioxygenase large terminal subunit
MRHDEQVRLMRRGLEHMAAGTTDRRELERSPVSRYTSVERAEQEARMIRSLPVMVGASSSVARPGDWFVHDLSGVPIVVARDHEGVLRAFVDACRHRGARVAGGTSGSDRRTFVCRYHAWTYGLDGRLRGMPHPEEFPGLDRAAHGLVPLPVHEAIGLVWVVPTPGATLDIAAWLGPMADDLRSFGYDRFVQYETRRFDTEADWKLLADANLETYHVRYLHQDTISGIFQDNRMVADAFGDHLRVAIPKSTLGALRDLPESQWRLADHVNIVYWFFPNLMFLLIGDHASMFAIWPRGVGRSTVHAITLVPEQPATDKARVHWDRNVRIFFDALMEDFDQMASMQSTFASGANTHLTFGRSEWCSAQFERTVERHLARLEGEAERG